MDAPKCCRKPSSHWWAARCKMRSSFDFTTLLWAEEMGPLEIVTEARVHARGWGVGRGPCVLSAPQSIQGLSWAVNWVCTLPAVQPWPSQSRPRSTAPQALRSLQPGLRFRHQVEFLLEMINPNPWQIFSKISNPLCLFYPGSFLDVLDTSNLLILHVKGLVESH